VRFRIAALRIVDREGEPLAGELRVFPGQLGDGRPPGEWTASGDAIPPPKGTPPRNPRCGVTNTLIHSVHIERAFDGWVGHELLGRQDEWQDRFQGLREIATASRRDVLPVEPGPRRLREEFLAAFAEVYLEEKARPNQQRPLVERLAERFDTAEGTIKRWRHLARDGILDPSHGRLGWALSEEGKELAARYHEDPRRYTTDW
jgi:hypothetical protein